MISFAVPAECVTDHSTTKNGKKSVLSHFLSSEYKQEQDGTNRCSESETSIIDGQNKVTAHFQSQFTVSQDEF